MEISMNALLKRINRKLVKDGKAIRTMRGGWERYGPPFYLQDIQSSLIIDHSLTTEDIVTLGREIGVLAPNEEIAGVAPG